MSAAEEKEPQSESLRWVGLLILVGLFGMASAGICLVLAILCLVR